MNPKDVLITFPELLIWFPLLSGLVAFFLVKGDSAKKWAIISSFITVAIVAASLFFTDKSYFHFNNVRCVGMPSYISAKLLPMEGIHTYLTLLKWK